MKIVCFLILLASSLFGASVVPSTKLPPARMLVPNALHGLGVVGGIPARTDPANIIRLADPPYNVGSSGNLTSAMQAAALALPDSGGEKVILIPAGEFTYAGASFQTTNGNIPKRDFTIRGAGMDQTIIHGGFGFGLGVDYGEILVNVTESTATRDATAVTVSSTAGMNTGQMARFLFPNDYRIPTLRFDNDADYNRSQSVRITGVNAGTNQVSFTPPLVADFSDLETFTGQPIKFEVETQYQRCSYVGLEDFTIDVTGVDSDPINYPGAGTQTVIVFQGSDNCWVKGVKFQGHTGHGMSLMTSTNFEMRKSYIGLSPSAGPGLSGVIWEGCTSMLIEDNIGLGNQPIFEGWTPSTLVVLSHNYIPWAINHLAVNVHNGVNQFLYLEGNIVPSFQIDAYYGNTIYVGAHRNWITGRQGEPGAPYTPSAEPAGHRGATYGSSVTDMQRGTRQVFFTGNLLGAPGSVTPAMSDQGYFLGYPYTGWITNGTAEPSTGDWWYDFNTTTHKTKSWHGTISDRSSDYTGAWTADSTAIADDMAASLALSSDGTRTGGWANQVYIGTRTGNTFQIIYSSRVMPALNAPGTFYPGYSGFREIDLDTGNQTTKRVNHNYYDNSIPVAEALGTDTLPDSILYPAKPSWFGSLAWPAINPQSAPTAYDTASVAIIPAAWRFLYGNENYLTGGSSGSSNPHRNVKGGTSNLRHR